ncbi:hypothetical protein NP284_13080 [Rhodopseudomonas pseudopalustris]|uniref:hypothetical protein n=1 Tax=Rhodopseudomonas pseudopalustris TaxID=1513892 RepID=UPI003F96D058
MLVPVAAAPHAKMHAAQAIKASAAGARQMKFPWQHRARQRVWPISASGHCAKRSAPNGIRPDRVAEIVQLRQATAALCGAKAIAQHHAAE